MQYSVEVLYVSNSVKIHTKPTISAISMHPWLLRALSLTYIYTLNLTHPTLLHTPVQSHHIGSTQAISSTYEYTSALQYHPTAVLVDLDVGFE